METKLFEVRDRMTFIPVICTKLSPNNEADCYLLARTGYGLRAEVQERYILYAPLREGKMECSSTDHPVQPRTHRMAHQHIEKHWGELVSGDVIDVEFILGETTISKISERLEGC